jgi:hypothetical protein
LKLLREGHEFQRLRKNSTFFLLLGGAELQRPRDSASRTLKEPLVAAGLALMGH